VATQAGYPGPGELIGPYQVGERLGQGGMGVVFAALDTQLNRRVALKIISPHLADDPEFRARFTREAQAQASLDSPNVVHVYAHGEVDGRLYIATQLVPDGDLGQMIQSRGAPSLPVAVDVIAQVASGLADAHAVGLVHRDIKPANVLLRIQGDTVRAYLADFGIARQVTAEHQLTLTGSTVGTPTYMAPELHTGGHPGPAYQVVTAHLTAPIPQLPETSATVAAVNRVLRIAMAKNPADRYRDAGAMRDDLRAALRAPETGPPTGPQPVAAPDRRRAGLYVVLVAVIVLGLVGLGVTYAATRRAASRPTPSHPRPSRPRPTHRSPSRRRRTTRRRTATSRRRSPSSPTHSTASRASTRAPRAAWRRSSSTTSGWSGWSRPGCSPPRSRSTTTRCPGRCPATSSRRCSRLRSTARCRTSRREELLLADDHDDPAVDEQHRARDQATRVGGQEADRRGHLLGAVTARKVE
jgi:hypothetical protein